jgi:DMSO/TMAO reductase YedYZ heme-binding membrane subunit
MKIAKHNSGFIIGAISTGISISLTATYIVPIISVSFGVIFETIAAGIVSNDPYSNVGLLTIKLLSVIFLFTLILCILSVINMAEKFGYITQRRIIGIMAIMFFIIHSLGFYIYWGVALHFESDGQLMFGALISFPISSFTFVLIGLLIDFAKNRALKKYIGPVV